MSYHGYTIDPKAFVIAGALLLWLLFVLLTLFWPRSKRGPALDVLTFAATLLLGFVWQNTFYSRAKAAADAQKPVCSAISPGMHDTDVREKAGTPDRVLSEEETRGPGAEVWVYDKSRCAVHVLLDTVEYIE